MSAIKLEIDILLDGDISSSKARQKWDAAEDSAARRKKEKGKPIFIHGQKGGMYTLSYYQSYGSDWCDTVFVGEIFEYDDGKSQIMGKIKASPAMKRFAAGVLILSVPLAILINVIMSAIAEFNIVSLSYNPTVIFAGTLLVSAFIGFMSLIVDKRRVKDITEYLSGFLREEKEDDKPN